METEGEIHGGKSETNESESWKRGGNETEGQSPAVTRSERTSPVLAAPRGVNPQRVRMRRAPGFSALFLFTLALIPRPGSLKHCRSCINSYLTEEKKTEKYYRLLVRNANYSECWTNVIEFKLPRGIICGDKTDSWVTKVIDCINQGRTPCLQPSENQQPRTTTQEFPTSTARTAPPLGQSTQTWTGGTLKPSESTTEGLSNIQKALKANTGLTTTGPDSDQDRLHGNGPTSEKDDLKSKMSQMTTAIISLLLIVLVMTAVGMYVLCRKGSFPHCKRHCVEETVRYQPTPSEEPIP